MPVSVVTKRRTFTVECNPLGGIRRFLSDHTGLKVSETEAVNWALRQCWAAVRAGKVTELGMQMPRPIPTLLEVNVDELSVPDEDEPTLVKIHRKRGTIG